MARCRNACILVLGILLPRLQFPNAAQPPPREQHSAPSAPIPPNHDTSGGSNHCPGRTSVHPRRRLPRLQFPNAAQPQSRAHRSTPSDSISPPAAVLNKGNHHPGRTAAHPRCKTTPFKTATRRATTTHLPPKAHHRAPSDVISPPAATLNRGNHHPVRNPMHPRHRLPRLQFPTAAQPPPREQHRAPSDAVSTLTAAPTPPNRR